MARRFIELPLDASGNQITINVDHISALDAAGPERTVIYINGMEDHIWVGVAYKEVIDMLRTLGDDHW